MSREHVFPDWLRQFFPGDKNITHTTASIKWSKTIITKSPRYDRKTRQGHSGTAKVRVVCTKCNNGWMSALEERTKPILIPLLTGNSANLSLDAQMVLATWAAKTTITAEHLRPREIGISQEDRTWLKNYLTPPKNHWFVWAAAYSDKLWRDLAIYQQRGNLQLSPVRRPNDPLYYVQSTTFGVGHVVFMTLSSSWPRIGNKFAGREANGLFQIWPPQPRSLLWPPARIFGDAQVNAIANVLNLSRAFNRSLNPSADWTFALESIASPPAKP